MQNKIETGTIIENRYRIESLLGRGGLGSVYKAYDQELNRSIAIKFLHTWLESDTITNTLTTDSTLKRFEREAKALSQLLHNNIIRVYRYGLLNNSQAFLVMELAEGLSLRTILEKKKLFECQEAVEIMLQIAQALEYSHKQQIVHRDLKPENIIVNNLGSQICVKILDFGLCKFDSEIKKMSNPTLTETGFLVGTTLYMSPEQCMGKTCDLRTDIYSFGCILYELISGSPPFISESPAATLFKHINDPIPNILELSPSSKFPQELNFLITKSLAKLPDSRFQSFTEIIDLLTSLSQLNSKARFDQKSAKANQFKLSTLSKFKLTKKALLIFSIICLSITSLLAYWLSSTNSGLLFITDRLFFFLTPPEVTEKLSAWLKELVDTNQANKAKNFYLNTTHAESYKLWSDSSKLILLSNYFNILQNSSFKNITFICATDLLSLIMDFASQNITHRTTLSQEQIHILNEICKFLLSNRQNKEEWKLINIIISKKESSFRDAKTRPYLLYPLILFLESEKKKSGIMDEDRIASIGTKYCSVMHWLLFNKNDKLFPKYNKESIDFCKQYNLLRTELRCRLQIASYYVQTNKKSLALQELVLIEKLAKETTLKDENIKNLAELQNKLYGHTNETLIKELSSREKIDFPKVFSKERNSDIEKKTNIK